MEATNKHERDMVLIVKNYDGKTDELKYVRDNYGSFRDDVYLFAGMMNSKMLLNENRGATDKYSIEYISARALSNIASALSDINDKQDAERVYADLVDAANYLMILAEKYKKKGD